MRIAICCVVSLAFVHLGAASISANELVIVAIRVELHERVDARAPD